MVLKRKTDGSNASPRREKVIKGTDYPNRVDEMVFLLTLNELVKINKEARSLWVVGARSLVEDRHLYCFRVLAIVDGVTVNVSVHASLTFL